jgi:SAM-dependent methyltransferase
MSPIGSKFDPLVDAYDTARPTYPDRLYELIEEMCRPLDGATVVEVGAGTGIATRGLTGRGARVLATDVSLAMLGRLRRHSPEQAAVVASGERLPVRDGAADLVCAAQAWHWLDNDVAAAEAVRVLRPGGHLALWWNNVVADGLDWFDAQQDRIEVMNPTYTRGYRLRPVPDPLEATGRFDRVDVVTASWSRALPIETYLTWLRSKSYVAAMGPRVEEFIEAERASLLAAFPDGTIVEPFAVRLTVAHRRG